MEKKAGGVSTGCAGNCSCGLIGQLDDEVSAFNACEFALIQRVAPQDSAAQAMGVYNGLTTIIGGGLGPFVVSPMIGSDGGTWVISAIAITNAMLLFAAYRLVRY